MWIDSHCHLNHERYGDLNPEDLAVQAKEQGVFGMVNISCTIRGDFPSVLKTAQDLPDVWCTVGTHPHDSGLEDEKAVTLEELIALARSDEKIVGIGESGLDYYYMNSPEEDQKAGFRKHIQACLETDLPLVMHTRQAEEDTAAIMREEGGDTLRAVMHCFSSNRWLAETALEMGHYISFSGIVTFKQSEELREIAKIVPLDRLLVETDAPFLAPKPHRGKTNEPAYVCHTGRFLAELLGVEEEQLARQTSENFFRVFSKAKQS